MKNYNYNNYCPDTVPIMTLFIISLYVTGSEKKKTRLKISKMIFLNFT